MTTLFKSNARQKAIDKNVTKRQKLKVKWDRHCKYSAEEIDQLSNQLEMYSTRVDANLAQNEENWVRMLDEGVVVDGDGEVYAVIKKGALKTYYDNLPDNFTGYIDRDHNRSIRLGEYSKKEMKLVELGDDRYGIDINVKLDGNYYATRDLLRQNEHRAVSVEMMTSVDEFALASKVTGEKQKWDYLVPLIGAVDILGYAVCENPKNANSIKDDLLDKASVERDLDKLNQGGEDMNEEELKKLEAQEAENAEGQAEEAETSTAEDQTPAPEVTTSYEAEGESKESEEPTEKLEAEEKAEEQAEEKLEAKEEDTETVKKGLEQLEAAITELRAELDEKNAKIAELENQLTARAETKMSTAERIAKLLNFAKGADATAAEGSKVDMTSDKPVDKYAADDALWEEAAKSLNY